MRVEESKEPEELDYSISPSSEYTLEDLLRWPLSRTQVFKEVIKSCTNTLLTKLLWRCMS
jgi:hypothetical protein